MKNDNFLDLVLASSERKTTYFHSTFTNFDKFDVAKSTFMHFGSREAAENRIGLKYQEDMLISGVSQHHGKTPFMMEVELDLGREFRLEENRSGAWQPFDVLKAVIEQCEESGDNQYVSEEELDAYYEDSIILEVDGEEIDFHDINLGLVSYKGIMDKDIQEREFVADWLQSKGIDSIVYENKHELGGDSFMVFRNEQVKEIAKEALPVFELGSPKNSSKPTSLKM